MRKDFFALLAGTPQDRLLLRARPPEGGTRHEEAGSPLPLGRADSSSRHRPCVFGDSFDEPLTQGTPAGRQPAGVQNLVEH